MTPEFRFVGLSPMRFGSLLSNTRILREYLRSQIYGVGSSYYLQHRGQLLRMTRSNLGIFLYEWSHWKRIYRPTKFEFGGKTVLDLGAGCGETAHFYFSLGAAKVIGIEPDQTAAAYFRENAERNDWNYELYRRKFKLADLQKHYDFMKMDCEGCEKLLLQNAVKSLKPCVIEAHSVSISRELARKFGMREITAPKGTWDQIRYLWFT